MSEQVSPAPPRSRPTERNPATTARFHRESWWQIYFPLLVMALLSIAAIVLLAVLGSQNGAVSVVGDYALMLVIIPILVGGLVVLVLLFGLIVGVAKLVHGMPPYANVAQQGVHNFSKKVEQVCDRITGVVINIRSVLAGVEMYLKHRGGKAPEPTDK